MTEPLAGDAEQRRELLAQMVLASIRRQPEMMLLRAFEANSAVEQSADGITLLVGGVRVASVAASSWWTPRSDSLALHAESLARELLARWLQREDS